MPRAATWMTSQSFLRTNLNDALKMAQFSPIFMRAAKEVFGMNMNQIINMITRMLMRRAVNLGVNASINAASSVGQKRKQQQAGPEGHDQNQSAAPQLGEKERGQNRQAKQAARQIRQMAKVTRRITRM